MPSQNPYHEYNDGISDVEATDVNPSGNDYVYFVNEDIIRLVDGNLEELAWEHTTINGNKYVATDIYYDEFSKLLYSTGIISGSTNAIVQAWEYELNNIAWEFSEPIGITNTLGSPYVNGVALNDDGKVFITGSLNAPAGLFFGNTAAESADHSDIIIARIVEDSGNHFYGRVTNNTNQIIEGVTIIEKEEMVETTSIEDMIIRPNPTSNTFELVTNVNNISNAQIHLFDIQGRMVKNIYEGSISQPTIFNVTVDNLVEGLYIVRMNYDGQITTKKIVIIK